MLYGMDIFLSFIFITSSYSYTLYNSCKRNIYNVFHFLLLLLLVLWIMIDVADSSQFCFICIILWYSVYSVNVQTFFSAFSRWLTFSISKAAALISFICVWHLKFECWWYLTKVCRYHKHLFCFFFQISFHSLFYSVETDLWYQFFVWLAKLFIVYCLFYMMYFPLLKVYH